MIIGGNMPTGQRRLEPSVGPFCLDESRCISGLTAVAREPGVLEISADAVPLTGLAP